MLITAEDSLSRGSVLTPYSRP
ncbi:unnamed protein product [Linum tenue]|uniref:Uncharacterized protein n=1 Tax=Linum tenue TaxID=586396 RepID=A0AAV0JF36_9ROSI|nr:unnamed protein product [Linum tenue]